MDQRLPKRRFPLPLPKMKNPVTTNTATWKRNSTRVRCVMNTNWIESAPFWAAWSPFRTRSDWSVPLLDPVASSVSVCRFNYRTFTHRPAGSKAMPIPTFPPSYTKWRPWRWTKNSKLTTTLISASFVPKNRPSSVKEKRVMFERYGVEWTYFFDTLL